MVFKPLINLDSHLCWGVFQVEKLAAKQKKSPDGAGPNIVLCGDFNSLPEEGVRELLENGTPKPSSTPDHCKIASSL